MTELRPPPEHAHPNDAAEIMALRLSTLAFRMQSRVDACIERNGTEDAAVTSSGIGISYLFGREIASTCAKAAEWFDRDPNAIATDSVKIADHIVREVCELGDRTSPDDWPEAMLVTGEELHAIVLAALAKGERT